MNIYNLLCKRGGGYTAPVDPKYDLTEQFWQQIRDYLSKGVTLIEPPILMPSLAKKKKRASVPTFVPRYFNLRVEAESSRKALQSCRTALNRLQQRLRSEGIEGDDVPLTIVGPNQSFDYHTGAPPNDDLFKYQKPYFDRMNVSVAWDAWEKVNPPNEIAVAIVDSGIFKDHEDFADPSGVTGSCLKKHLGENRNFPGELRDPTASDGNVEDPFGHGTMIAGILGATINNNKIGIAGLLGASASPTELGPKADLIIARVGFRNRGLMNETLSALDWIDTLIQTIPIRIVLLAWGAIDPHPDVVADLRLRLKNLGGTKSPLIVTSAGKSENDLGMGEQQLVVYPAMFGGNKPDSLPNVICVGASYHDKVVSPPEEAHDADVRVSGSPYSILDAASTSYIDIFAPGDQIQTLGRSYTREYVTDSGTSFAAAHVAGIAALLFATKPAKTAADVKTWLQNNSSAPAPSNPVGDGTQDITKICVAGLYKGGILDAAKAFKNW